MLGWTYLFPPKRPTAPGATAPSTTTTAVDGADAKLAAGSPTGAAGSSVDGSAKDRAPLTQPRTVDAEERTFTLDLGQPGRPGHYRAVFTNRGAALKELRTANYVDHAGLAAAEQGEFAHWATLVSPVESDGRPQQSMVVRSTSASARELEVEPLESELWVARTLADGDVTRGVEFEISPGTGVAYVKRFTFAAGEDRLRVEFEVRNVALPERQGKQGYALTPAVGMPSDSGDRWYVEPQSVAVTRPNPNAPLELEVVAKNESTEERSGSFRAGIGDPLSFAGVFNKYFAVLLRPADDASRDSLTGASWRRIFDDAWKRAHPAEAQLATRQIATDVQFELPLPPLGESRGVRFDVYAGPKDREALFAAHSDHLALIDHDLGMFSSIAHVLLAVLGFFESITSNWGFAIILLTLSVRLLLFPINRRSQTAMARYQTKLKRLQPKIDEIKKKYASDASRQRQEQAKLMQAEGAFPPLGGCLPMFLQIPVFIGLYRALGVSFELRQAPFLGWIHDLSLPDQFLRIDFNTHIPFVGTIEYLNLLPPLMVVLWIWQQKGMPVPADEQAARMQKMMMWMPVMMGFFLYNYAAGLSLYMITQSGVGIIEQKVIKKYWPVDDVEREPKKKGFIAKLMEAQQAQMKKMESQQRRTPRKVKR
jgi:YidC/Oxa1 family membrane protein insertase